MPSGFWERRLRAIRTVAPLAGLAIAIVGITISILMVIVGLLVFALTAIAWIRDARREFGELPLDHHGGH